MHPRIEISDEKRQQAYVFYACDPKRSLKDIQSFLGVSPSTFVRLRQRWGWPPRLAALEQNRLGKGAFGADVPAPAIGATGSLREAARSLAQATRSQIDALMKDQRTGRTADHDKTSRTLASYARTLAAAQALLEQEGSQPDDMEPADKPRRSLGELRDELARHLERVVAEEEARGRDGLLV